MPPLAFTLALAAAFLHAFWNILLARARDVESATAVALIAAVVVFAPVTVLRFDAEWAVWPFIVVTSLLQLLYFALLATAYRKAELSFVYPVARGVAPALVLVVSVIVLGHGTSAAQVAGVVLVGVGVLLVRGLKRPADSHALAFALGIAFVIAAYTLLDKRGITHASPITYLELSMVPAALAYACATVAVQGPRRRAGGARTGVPARRLRVVRRLRARAGGARAGLRRLGRGGAGDERRDRDGLRGCRPARGREPLAASRAPCSSLRDRAPRASLKVRPYRPRADRIAAAMSAGPGSVASSRSFW